MLSNKVLEEISLEIRPTIIRTDKFNLAFMGRSGSRSILVDILSHQRRDAYEEHSQFYWHFYNDPVLLNKQARRYTDSDIFPHILVIRNPLDRKNSARLGNMTPWYHAMPFLHLVNFDLITHIIKFEDLSKYFKEHIGFVNSTTKAQQQLTAPDEYLADVDFDRENNLYNKLIKEKPIMDIESFKWAKNHIKFMNNKNDKGIEHRPGDIFYYKHGSFDK